MIMLFLNFDPLMKNTYGFYRGGAEPLSTETFLIQNTLGLAGLFGISASFADVALTPLSNPVSVMGEIQRKHHCQVRTIRFGAEGSRPYSLSLESNWPGPSVIFSYSPSDIE